MDLHRMIRGLEKTVVDNSPAILTGLGVAGLISTAVFSVKAGYRSQALIWREQEAREALAADKPWFKIRDQRLTVWDKIELCWKLYIPAVATGALSAACIIGANRVGTRRAAALASAYTISERAFTEYREKVVEKLGEKKEQEVRSEIAQDRVNRLPQDIAITPVDGKVMCHDAFSNSYFQSDMETLRRAENNINYQILHGDYATINDFYDQINGDLKPKLIEYTSESSEMGWNTDKPLELGYSTVMYQERIPCISYEFVSVPIREPWRFS